MVLFKRCNWLLTLLLPVVQQMLDFRTSLYWQNRRQKMKLTILNLQSETLKPITYLKTIANLFPLLNYKVKIGYSISIAYLKTRVSAKHPPPPRLITTRNILLSMFFALQPTCVSMPSKYISKGVDVCFIMPHLCFHYPENDCVQGNTQLCLI